MAGTVAQSDVMTGFQTGARVIEPGVPQPLDHATRQTTELALPRWNAFVSDMPDRGLFAAFALSGGTAVFVLKSAGVPAWPVAILALVLMATYGVMICLMPRLRLRRDRVGDNFYYLGFVFTLASMSAALYQLTGGVKVEPILGSFAIALITTIFGIVGRVVFVQMRPDIDETEKEIRHDLLDAATLLKRQLDVAVHEMESFRRGAIQAMQEQFDDTAKVNVRHAERMSAVVLRMIEASEQLVARLDAIDPPGEVLNRKLSAVADRLDEAAVALAIASESETERRESLTRLGLHVQELLAMFAAQTAQMKPHAVILDSVGKAADALAGSLGRLDNAVAGEAARLKEAAAQSSAARREIQEDVAESHRTLVDVQRAMADTAWVVAAHLSRRDDP